MQTLAPTVIPIHRYKHTIKKTKTHEYTNIQTHKHTVSEKTHTSINPQTYKYTNTQTQTYRQALHRQTCTHNPTDTKIQWHAHPRTCKYRVAPGVPSLHFASLPPRISKCV